MIWRLFHWDSWYVYKRLWLVNSMCGSFLTKHIHLYPAFMLIDPICYNKTKHLHTTVIRVTGTFIWFLSLAIFPQISRFERNGIHLRYDAKWWILECFVIQPNCGVLCRQYGGYSLRHISSNLCPFILQLSSPVFLGLHNL